jgi:hypothetical protein
MWAARWGDKDVVISLIEYGADVNMANTVIKIHYYIALCVKLLY